MVQIAETPWKKQSDQELIRRYRAGDKRACDALLERYGSIIDRRVKRVGISGTESDDLRQEAYLGLMGAIRSYDPEKNTSFAAYAALCVGNSIKNLFAAATTRKAQWYRQAVSLDALDPGSLRVEHDRDPECIYLVKEACGTLQRLMEEHLSELEKDVLLSYLSGRDYSDIAARLHSSPKSVDNALQRARRKLKAALGRC